MRYTEQAERRQAQEAGANTGPDVGRPTRRGRAPQLARGLKTGATPFLCVLLAALLVFGCSPAPLFPLVAEVAYADSDDDAQKAAEEEAARKKAEEEAAAKAEAERKAAEEAERKAEEERKAAEEAERKAKEEVERKAAEEAARKAEEERKAAEEAAKAEEERQRQEQESGGGSGGSGDQPGSSESSGAADPADGNSDESPSASPVKALYLFYQNYDKPERPLPYSPKANPLITEAKGTMELYVQCELASGTVDWVAASGVRVVWSIEETYDENGAATSTPIAEIDRGSGKVRALGQGNGRIKVRCQVQDADVCADMELTIKGNSGVPYITDLQICDENGEPYANDAEIRIESSDFGVGKNFYVRATYNDPNTGEQTVRNTKDGDAVEGATWTCSGDAKTAYVNQDTGVFIAQGAGSIRLTCSIAGAGKLGETMSDYVMVLCGGDTLDKNRTYSPAGELKVVVKYATEDKQGIGGESDYETARTWYYSPGELEALGATENLYTLVKSDGNWATMKARGVYLQRLVEDVINAEGFSLDMIKGFYFGATDAYNPGFVGEGWLFETQRYYYPNMSIGSGKSGAIGVAPMIATATAQQDLVDEPSGSLSSQTRFRLCMGAESTTANNAQQSIYNIHTITIILNGAPPVGWDEPNGGHGTSNAGGSGGAGGSPSSGDDSQGEGQGTGSDAEQGNVGEGAGPGDPSNPSDQGNSGESKDSPEAQSNGSTQGDESDSADAKDEVAQRDSQAQAEGVQGANVQQAETTVQMQAESAETVQDQQEQEQKDETAPTDDLFGDEQHRWQVYEMMSNSPAVVEALAIDNPLAPFVAPFVLLVALAGAVSNYVGFKRRLNPLAARGAESGDGTGDGGKGSNGNDGGRRAPALAMAALGLLGR